jgi:hypothetical protein
LIAQVDRAESGSDDDEIEDTNENEDTESEKDDTFIIAIPIASKYLARLEKWGTFGFPASAGRDAATTAARHTNDAR